MSEEIAKQCGFTIGQKVLYIHYRPYVVLLEIVTIKDIRPQFRDGEIVVDVKEFEGYLNLSSIYSKESINKRFEQ